MEFRIIREINDFRSLKCDWEKIEKTSKNITYFSTFQYCFTWFENFKSIEEKLFIVTVTHNNKIVGIAPFKIRKVESKLLKKRVVEFISDGDYADLLLANLTDINCSNIISKIFECLFENDKEWDEINLTHISQNSLLVNFLLSRKYNKCLSYLIENPFIDFSKYKDHDEYSKEFISSKLKQYSNKFQKKINYKIIVTNDNVINSISKIHLAQKEDSNINRNKKRHSHFENKSYFNFLTKLYTNNKNVLTYLLIDTDNKDEIISYFTGYVYNNKFHSVSTAVNPKYNHFRVGRVFNNLIYKLNWSDKKWEVFDMGAGRYEWKFELTNSFNLLYTFNYENFKNTRLKVLVKLEKILSAINQIVKN